MSSLSRVMLHWAGRISDKLHYAYECPILDVDMKPAGQIHRFRHQLRELIESALSFLAKARQVRLHCSDISLATCGIRPPTLASQSSTLPDKQLGQPHALGQIARCWFRTVLSTCFL